MKFGPHSRINRPFGSPLEVHRCEADGGLVTNSQAFLKQHAGHRVKQPVYLTESELLGIWLRIIR